jgi:hypothetical protein
MEIPTFKKDSLLIFIDPFVDPINDREDKSRGNKYSTKVLDYIKEPTNNINYLFVCVYDCPSFIKNEKWCGKTSKRFSLENRVFTKKIVDYKPSLDTTHIYCPTLDSKFDEFNYKNILTTSAFFTKDLTDFLDTFPNIKNVIIAGEAWQLCIRTRPLGLFSVVNALKKYKKVNLLIEKKLIGGVNGFGVVLNEDEDRIVGEPSWEKIGDSLFYLPKDKYDVYLEQEIHFYEKEFGTEYETDNHHPKKSLEKAKVDQQINLTLNDCISAKHLKLNLNDKISNSEIFE